MNEYTSLSQLRTYISLGSADTTDDVNLLDLIRVASRGIDKATRRKFYPFRRTLKFDLPENRQVLKFGRDDVLQVKGLSDINGASEIDAGAYVLKCGDTYNLSPYDRVNILTDTGSAFNFSGTDQQAVHSDVITGYHEDYDNAWINANASLTQPLNAGTSNTLASVSGSAGINVNGFSPRFSTQQIWRLDAGASNEEYVYVSDTAPGTDGSVVKLVRGINGTSALDHATSTVVEVFDFESDVEFMARRLSSFVYEQSRSPFTGRVAALQLGIIEMPDAWPTDVQDKLKRFKKMKLYAADF